SGNVVNEWNLKLGEKTPLDLVIHLGAGRSVVDASSLALRGLEIHMGAGELQLDLSGNYKRDLNVNVHGGVGEARIKLPKDFPVIATAKGGIGSINVHGLQEKDGRYRNNAYAEGKPAINLDVRGGVGEINLSVK